MWAHDGIRSRRLTLIIGLCTFIFAFQKSIYPSNGNENTKKLIIPESPEELPYILKPEIPSAKGSDMALFFGDINYDGRCEYFQFINTIMEDSRFHSRVVIFKNYIVGDTRQENQYNSKYAHCKIIAHDFLDVVGDQTMDLILTKREGDKLFLEILGLDSLCRQKEVHFVEGAIGQSRLHPINWGDIHVYPLSGIDLNGDGHKDLIYSRSAQPDSAVARGIVAYDIANQNQLWFYPTADLVRRQDFYLIDESDTEECFVFAIMSNVNAYASNGMDSDTAYIAAIDIGGNELWRKVAGGPWFNPATCIMDVDNDGVPEFFIGNDNRDGNNPEGLRLKCYGAVSGKVFCMSDDLGRGKIESLITLSDSGSGEKSIYANIYHNPDYSIYKFDKNLKLLGELRSDFLGPICAGHIMPLRGPQLVAHFVKKGRPQLGIFDENFRLIACADAAGVPSISNDPSGKTLIIAQAGNGFDVFTLVKQPIIDLVYARYKWWLAMLTALTGAIFLIVVGRRLPPCKRLISAYHSLAGISGLDKVSAMILVLNRKGNIVFANDNPLTKQLLNDKSKSWRAFRESSLSRYPHILDFLQKSLKDQYSLLEGQFEIHNGSHRNILLIAYPRVDRNNIFQGKIIIGEDITDKADFKRKAMLGDAVRFWIHQFKGKMATIDLLLENLQTADTQGQAEANTYGEAVRTISAQTGMAKQMAERILKFIRMGKPELIECDINMVLNLALDRSGVCSMGKVTVVKKLQKDLPQLPLDLEQITEMFMNLIANAIEAMKGSGTLTVISDLANKLHHNLDGDMVEIEIRDTGQGIAKDNLDKIFWPGFTGKSNGTGLGLAFVKEIIENHGGSIEVKSEINMGTTFIVLLPIKTN